MNILLKTAFASLVGFGLAVGAAQAALPPKGKTIAPVAPQQTQTAPKTIERPAIAPDGCPAGQGNTQRTNCVAETTTSSSGAKVRVIPIYNTSKVAVCMTELGGCGERR